MCKTFDLYEIFKTHVLLMQEKVSLLSAAGLVEGRVRTMSVRMSRSGELDQVCSPQGGSQ